MQPEATGVRLTPATPTIVALQLAQTLMPTMVAQAWAYPCPHAVAPQHVILYPTFTPTVKDTPARVTVFVHVRNGFVQVGHQYLILTLSDTDFEKCLVKEPSLMGLSQRPGIGKVMVERSMTFSATATNDALTFVFGVSAVPRSAAAALPAIRTTALRLAALAVSSLTN